VVRLGRLERPTSCFGGTRSIQLSYSRTLPLYHALLHARILVVLFLSGELNKDRTFGTGKYRRNISVEIRERRSGDW
jgi:hypothetical protein